MTITLKGTYEEVREKALEMVQQDTRIHAFVLIPAKNLPQIWFVEFRTASDKTLVLFKKHSQLKS
jgi:hypothetical protein